MESEKTAKGNVALIFNWYEALDRFQDSSAIWGTKMDIVIHKLRVYIYIYIHVYSFDRDVMKNISTGN